MKQKIVIIFIFMMAMSQTIWGKTMPQLAAEGIVLIEPETNTVLFSKNENEKLYPASITKILTSYMLIQDMNQQQLITKSQNSVQVVPRDSSHIGLKVGDSYSFKNGLYGLMLGSDNFIAHDMARADAGSISTFAERMNETAKKMGAKNSHFVNPHGYHDANHYTTAYDMAQIARVAFSDPMLQKIAGTSAYQFKVSNNNKSLTVKNSAQVLQKSSPYYNPHIVSVKTGYHSIAKQTIVARAEYDHISLIAVVMKTNRPNQYTDLNKLFEYGAENFSVEKKADGTYKLINQTAASWAKPYIADAINKGWIESDESNYQQPVSGRKLTTFMNKALGIEQLAMIGKNLEKYKACNQISRREFGALIEALSKEESIKLKTVDGDQPITYEEAICIVYRLII